MQTTFFLLFIFSLLFFQWIKKEDGNNYNCCGNYIQTVPSLPIKAGRKKIVTWKILFFLCVFFYGGKRLNKTLLNRIMFRQFVTFVVISTHFGTPLNLIEELRKVWKKNCYVMLWTINRFVSVSGAKVATNDKRRREIGLKSVTKVTLFSWCFHIICRLNWFLEWLNGYRFVSF